MDDVGRLGGCFGVGERGDSAAVGWKVGRSGRSGWEQWLWWSKKSGTQNGTLVNGMWVKEWYLKWVARSVNGMGHGQIGGTKPKRVAGSEIEWVDKD